MTLPDPSQFIGRGQDGVWDVELERALHEVDESERVVFLRDVLVGQERARFATKGWFRMAYHVLRRRQSYEALLEAGLEVVNVSSVRYWLEFALPRLGFPRLLRLLARWRAARPQGVTYTFYWLPRIARNPEERALACEFVARATSVE